MRRMEKAMLEAVDGRGPQRGALFSARVIFYKVILSGNNKQYYQIDPKTPGWSRPPKRTCPSLLRWEDSTLGNMYAAACIRGDVKNVHTVRTGIEYMTWLANFYTETTKSATQWDFQNGGGIARAISRSAWCRCCTRTLAAGRSRCGLLLPDQRFDNHYGSILRGRSQRKDHLGKAGRRHSPKFIIESDATIVAPLDFRHILGW